MKINLAICLVAIFAATFLQSQELSDARSLSMAGSNSAATSGSENIGNNPANLARFENFNFELHLLTAHLFLRNNSLSLDQYEKYFTTGDSLTSKDIDDIFGSIPGSGLKGDVATDFKLFSIYARPFAFAIYGMGSGELNLPKSPLQLPFYGNTQQSEYRLDDLDAEGWLAAAAAFAIALPFNDILNNTFDQFSVGIAPKYIFGLQYGEILNSKGIIQTEDDFIFANGEVEARTSEGGSAFSLDLGVAATYQKKWNFGLHFSNMIGSINWTKNNELHTFKFEADTIRMNDLDSLETNDSDTSVATGNFKTALPRVMTIAVSYQMRKDLMITAAWRQGLNSSLNNITKPLISFGLEYEGLPVIPLRGGFALGGESGFALGLGTGINLGVLQLSIGYLNHNFKWFKSAKSMELALTTTFRF